MITTTELKNWLTALTQGLPINITQAAAEEVLRVYGLGEWAKDYGIEALEYYRFRKHLTIDQIGCGINFDIPGRIGPPYLKDAEHGFEAKKALAALPKDSE